MPLIILLYFLEAQHVSGTTIPLIKHATHNRTRRSPHITINITRNTLPATTKRQRTLHRTYTTKKHNFTLTLLPQSLQNETTNQRYSRELLMMGIIVPETC